MIKIKITNIHNLPVAIVNAVSNNIQKPSKNVIRVSELINAPKPKELRMKHWNEITEDVSERLWSLLGQSMHHILESGAPENAFREERLSSKIDGVTISGQSDLWYEGDIEDYKTTSVYSFLLGIKPEWIAQLNVYRWLWTKAGFHTKSLKIHAILRDWVRSKALTDPNYPQIHWMTVDIPMWTLEETEIYIRKRIALHKLNPAPDCTDEEKWARPTTYAVIEEGAKRAKRVCSTLAEAKMWIKQNSKWYIVIDEKKAIPSFYVMKKGLKKHKADCKTLEKAEAFIKKYETLKIDIRKGVNVKCEGYCNVSQWCNCK